MGLTSLHPSLWCHIDLLTVSQLDTYMLVLTFHCVTLSGKGVVLFYQSNLWFECEGLMISEGVSTYSPVWMQQFLWTIMEPSTCMFSDSF